MKKRVVRYFVSYAHADGKLPEKLLKKLVHQFGACGDYEFERWKDTDILVGEKWHTEIQNAIRECDFGLLLVSPAFLSSTYIGEHELPHFVGGSRPCLPVALCRIDFENHDLKGLKASQLFRYQSEGAESPRVFADYNAKLQADFALVLFQQITARLKKLFASGSASAANPGLSTSIPHNLPTLQPFFGREDELKKIADALDPDSRTWGVLIDGPGGMGKTSLAVRAAYAAPTDAFNKIAFVSLKTRELDDDGVRDLSGFILTGLAELFGELARLLGHDSITKADEKQRPRLLLEALGGTRTLLVLDNLESLTKPERDTLFTFLDRLPAGCKAILTARGRIGTGAKELILEKLSEQAALATLAELASHNPLLAQTSEAERLVLYRETAGKPLLLRWTAGQLGRGHCITFNDALHYIRSCPPENDPLEFIFGDLVEGFSDAETKVLSVLTYFTLPAKVQHLAPLAGFPGVHTDRALRSLVNRSLVVPSDEFKTFTLVPMVADFLRRKKPVVIAEMGGQLEDQAYVLVVENGYNEHDRFPVLDVAWPTITAALPRFFAGSNDLLQTVCTALQVFLNFSGRWDEWLAISRMAEAKAMVSWDFRHAAWRASDAGWIYYLRGQAEEVLACADRAAASWNEAKAGAREQAVALSLRGTGHQLKGDFPAAIANYREAVKLHQTLNRESSDVAIGLNYLAEAERHSGELDAAELNYREALRIARAVDYREGVASYIGNLAALALDRQNWPSAETFAREALRLSEKIGRQEVIAADCCRLAEALVRQGKAAKGLPYARRAVDIFAQCGSTSFAPARIILAECEAQLTSSP